jgi:hypothetical protein
MMDHEHEMARAHRERLHEEARERRLATQARAGRERTAARTTRNPRRVSGRWRWTGFLARPERSA